MGRKVSLLIALPIAQIQRALMDHLSPITPLVPIPSSQTQLNYCVNTTFQVLKSHHLTNNSVTVQR